MKKETWVDEDYSKLALKEHIFDKIEKTLTESDMDKIEKIQLDNNIREYTRQRLMWQIEDLRNIKLETIPSVLVDIAREIKALYENLTQSRQIKSRKNGNGLSWESPKPINCHSFIRKREKGSWS